MWKLLVPEKECGTVEKLLWINVFEDIMSKLHLNTFRITFLHILKEFVAYE